MELRHMRHFVAVAEELHFGRAAQRLNMSQPPLSQSIRRLEVDLGVTLFDRSRRGVEMTDAGWAFLSEARRTLMQADLSRKVAVRAAEHSIDIRVSFIGPALYRILPKLLVEFRGLRPEVNIRLFEKSSPEQIPGILAGDYDIGFVTAGSAQHEGCETLLVERSPLIAAVPADRDLAQQDEITLAQLAEQDFISAPLKNAPEGYDALAIFKNAGVVPRVTQEASQTNTTLSLVGAGVGCGIVSGTASLTSSRNVAFLPITDIPSYLRWELMMVWLPDHLDQSAAAFVEMVQTQLAAHPDWLDVNTPMTDN